MNQKILTYCTGMLLATVVWQQAWAQTDTFGDDDWGRSGSVGLESTGRKSGSLFLRPRQEDATQQLAYARQLEASDRLRRAGRQYNALVHRWPDSHEAAEAQLALSRLLLERGRYERAFKEFQYLIEHHQGEFAYGEVLAYQLEAATAVKEQRRGGLLILPGFQNPERAIPLLETIVRNGPNWSQIPDIRLEIARIHENARQYEEAVAAYEEVIIYHGRHPATREAIFRKAICLKQIADRHPRDETRTRSALSALFAVLRTNPESEQAADVQVMIASLRQRLEDLHFEKAEFYDRIARKPQAALISYREFQQQFPASSRREDIEKRINVLEANAGE